MGSPLIPDRKIDVISDIRDSFCSEGEKMDPARLKKIAEFCQAKKRKEKPGDRSRRLVPEHGGVERKPFCRAVRVRV